ncbi:MAG TPA: hypothetical protein VI565_00170 [Burkholderiales bacterium]|nr:hypothetical protein [Burkholderiales bacterium]
MIKYPFPFRRNMCAADATDPTADVFVLQPCRTSAAFEAFPRRRRRIALDAASQLLLARGFEIVHHAGVLLLVRGRCDVSVYATGKLLLKTKNADLAREEAERIFTALLAM